MCSSVARHGYVNMQRWLSLACLGCVLAALAGCHASPWSSASTPLDPATAPVSAAIPSPEVSPTDFQSNEQDLRRVMAEAHRLGAENPALAEPLLAELKASDPSLWPLVVESFRARLAYGQELRQKEAIAARSALQPTVIQPTGPVTPPSHTPPSPAESNVARLPATDQAILVPETVNPLDGSTTTTVQFDPRASAESEDDTSEIVAASYEEHKTDRWQSLLSDAIRRLQTELENSPLGKETNAQRTRLRLLQLAAGRSEAASIPEPVRSKDEAWLSRFWTSEMALLGTVLDTNAAEPSPKRLAAAGRHLAGASASLSEAAPLEVRHPAFCRAIHSFGSIKRFEDYTFRPNQRVLLYCEVENFRAEHTPHGYHTSLQSRYEIVDADGKEVYRYEPAPTEEFCANRRRDYFLGCDFRLPRQLKLGDYTLIVTVEDLKNGKTGQATVDFAVKD
jgi:hypothetical protein